jgi:hypothetical protein
MLKYFLVILLLFSCSRKFKYDPNDQNQFDRIENIELLIESRKNQAELYDLGAKYDLVLQRFQSRVVLLKKKTRFSVYF